MGNVVAAVILAGGKSTRMGTDKAAVHVGGIMMLERVVRAAQQVCNRVIVVGRDSLPDGWIATLPVELLPDEVAGRGPMAGLVAALRRIKETDHGDVLLLSCDLPLLTPHFLRELLNAHETAGPHRIATLAERLDVNGEPRIEPTVAVYAMTLLPELERRLATHRLALHAIREVDGAAAWRVPPQWASTLLNVNTAAELAEAERRADPTNKN